MGNAERDMDLHKVLFCRVGFILSCLMKQKKPFRTPDTLQRDMLEWTMGCKYCNAVCLIVDRCKSVSQSVSHVSQSVSLSVCLSVCLFVCLSVCLHVYLFLYVCPMQCLYISKHRSVSQNSEKGFRIIVDVFIFWQAEISSRIRC